MARSCTAGRCGLPAVVRLASVRGVDVCDEHAWNLLASSGSPLGLECRYRDGVLDSGAWERLWQEPTTTWPGRSGFSAARWGGDDGGRAAGRPVVLQAATAYRSGLAAARARWRALEARRDEKARPPARR